MTILLPALAVSFAAFTVWLTVRIINRRERWAKWTLAAFIGFPVLYILGFGLLIRLTSSESLPRWIAYPITKAYQPLLWLMWEGGPEWIGRSLYWWVQLWE